MSCSPCFDVLRLFMISRWSCGNQKYKHFVIYIIITNYIIYIRYLLNCKFSLLYFLIRFDILMSCFAHLRKKSKNWRISQGDRMLWLQITKKSESTYIQRFHNLRKFPQIYVVSIRVVPVLVIVTILCILFKILCYKNSFQRIFFITLC